MPSYDLNGKVALVTGAARGIGFETARQLHRRGASVAVLDLDAGEAREAAERIGPRTFGVGADVTDEGGTLAAVAAVVDRFGGLDIAVANAGIAPPTVTTARTMPGEEWKRVVDVNLIGAWHTARAALPQVSERGGQIVFIGSIYSFANGLLASPYAVSKAGVEALGRALRAELAPLGASASVVYFGWVDTDLVRDSLDRRDDGRGARILGEILPAFLLKRITAETAGATIARALEERAPQAFAPRIWRYLSAVRGLINPLLDRRMDRDAEIAAVVAEVEAAQRERA
ncbi:MAG TPA: short-chain dehydrogenase/reductase [Solirubrobacterales bacterium]|jgi:NAD(P)-dependent dehydrogenase (short-subunit alcohol dehydrogenase family)|nr:short-chain dehydrogenase/reductase [Solirubrobacterales bacterium]